MVGIFTFNFEMKSIRILNPFLLTLDTGKIGQIVAVGICSAVFSSSIFVVFYSLMRMGNLLSSLLFNIFLISVIVYSYLFQGAKSIFVTITKNGIFKNKQSPICYLVILDKPIFAPTTTHPKSGARPVSPLMVVFKYFSWPHKSTMEIILALSLTTSFQYLFLFWLNLSGIICLPYSLKPIIYWAIELVRPVSCSCLQLKILVRAPPLPSSGMPFVSTATSVDLPASTLPMMPILICLQGICFSYQYIYIVNCQQIKPVLYHSQIQKNQLLFFPTYTPKNNQNRPEYLITTNLDNAVELLSRIDSLQIRELSRFQIHHRWSMLVVMKINKFLLIYLCIIEIQQSCRSCYRILLPSWCPWRAGSPANFSVLSLHLCLFLARLAVQ